MTEEKKQRVECLILGRRDNAFMICQPGKKLDSILIIDFNHRFGIQKFLKLQNPTPIRPACFKSKSK